MGGWLHSQHACYELLRPAALSAPPTQPGRLSCNSPASSPSRTSLPTTHKPLTPPHLAWRHTGDQLLVSSSDSSHYLFHTSRLAGPPLARMGGHVAGSFYVKSAFSSDGRCIASGSSDGRVYVWDVSGGREQGGLQWLFQSLATSALPLAQQFFPAACTQSP